MLRAAQQSPILAVRCDRIRDESGPAGRQSDEAEPINTLGEVIDQ